jgi:hypothetical protein
VSSSCSTEPSPPEAAVGPQLARAFSLLGRNAPAAHDEIARRLGAVRVRIRVDDEVFDVARKRSVPRVCAAEGSASVSIDTTRAVVRDVLTGRRMMAEVIRVDALRVRGALRDLVATLAALEAFVHGAVRCAAVADLFDEFLTERVA